MRRQPPRTREQPPSSRGGVPSRSLTFPRERSPHDEDPRERGGDVQKHSRVATYWEAEALRSAVTTSEWIFIQRLRTSYYIKWRLYAKASTVHREYDSVLPMTENLKQERSRLQADLRRMQIENDELKDEIRNMQGAMGTIQAKQHGMQRDIEGEAARRKQIEDSLAAERGRNDELAAERDKLRKQIQDAKSSALASAKEIEYLAAELDRANELEAERERLKKQLQDAKTRAQTTAKELEYLKKIAETKGKEAAREREEKKLLQQQLNSEKKKPPPPPVEREMVIAKKTVTEKVSPKNYPELGLCLTDTLPRPIGKRGGKQKREDGIKVVGVRGPAKKAGILPEDTVLAINGHETPDLALFRELLTNLPPKEPLSIMIERNQQISTVRVVPNASTEVPGHSFQRLVWLPRDDRPEADASISRLAAPKGSYYDDSGKLHSIYDDEEVRPSPPGTPRSRDSGSRSHSPMKMSPRRKSSLDVVSPGKELVGTEGSWSWAPESPRGRHGSPLRKQESIRRGDSPGSEMSGYTAMTQGTGYVGQPSIRVGARVRRNNAYWQWGDQDGGPGNLGTVAKVDKVLGWVTVRWDATGKGSTYRWGKDDAWDVEEVSETQGHSAPPMMGESTQRPPPQRTRIHHTQSIPTSTTQSLYDEEGYSDVDATSDPGAGVFVPAYAPHPQ